MIKEKVKAKRSKNLLVKVKKINKKSILQKSQIKKDITIIMIRIEIEIQKENIEAMIEIKIEKEKEIQIENKIITVKVVNIINIQGLVREIEIEEGD